MSETMDMDMDLTIKEQHARIEQLQADALLKGWEALKRQQEIKFNPFTILASGVAATAALIGAVVAFMKFLG